MFLDDKRVSIDGSKGSPLGAAVCSRKVDIPMCKRLLSKFPNINVNRAFLTEHPLEMAIYKQDMKLLEFLLSIPQIDVNTPNSDSGNPPIAVAMSFNTMKMFNRLLNHPKADFKHVNNDGQNLLEYTCDKFDTKQYGDGQQPQRVYFVNKLWQTGQFTVNELQFAELKMIEDEIVDETKFKFTVKELLSNFHSLPENYRKGLQSMLNEKHSKITVVEKFMVQQENN